MSREEADAMKEFVQKTIVAHPEEMGKAARIIAQTFYKELRKYGFNEKEVLVFADELLSCLNDSFKGFQDKMEHKK